MESGDYYEMLLGEICWSFDEPNYSNLEEFYVALQKYQLDITGEVLDEESTYGLEFKEARIEFKYCEETKNGWKDTQRTIHVKSDGDEFNEIELLFKIHNAIQYLFEEYDHKYLEGLELINSDEGLVYKLILGS